MERPTLSQSWNRVDKLTPKLRSQVQIRRQLFRGEPWYVVHDPISNQFFRLNPVAYYFVGLLDGHRTVDEAWNLTLDRYGDEAPTQNEVIGLLGQLNSSNLLRVDDLPANAEPLLKRHRERKMKKWGGQLMNILFVRIPVFNPEPILKWVQPFFNPILNKVGLILWAAWLIFGLYIFLPHFSRFTSDVFSVLAPSNWAWMIVLFIVTKAIHELGHGVVCKRFGGVVPEVGIMLLVLFPAPYVDATSSWNFTSKYKRILVAAAGMMFELAVAAGAAILWVNAEKGSLTQQLSYNVVFLASVTTILFNANPLIRFDGYYILSDLLDVPNMYERSKKHLYWIVQRFAYGMDNVYPSSTSVYEAVVMTLYGIASFVYRVLLLTGIILFIMGQLFFVGILLACWSFIAWMIVPLGKFIRWLVTNPSLHEKRPRAIGVTAGFAAVVFVLIGVIPVPERRWADGIVESQQRAEVAVQTAGFVEEVRVQPGQRVEQGDVLIVARNPELESRQRELEAELTRVRALVRQSLTKEPVEYQANVERRQTVADALADVKERLSELTLRAPQDGTVVGSDLAQLEGRYLGRGNVICRVSRLDDLRVTAVLDQAQNDSLKQQIGVVELRTAGHIKRELTSRVVKFFDSGTTQLPHPALGYGGGGEIAVKQDDPNGVTALQPVFPIWLEMPLVLQRPEQVQDQVRRQLVHAFGPVEVLLLEDLPESSRDGWPDVIVGRAELASGDAVNLRLDTVSRTLRAWPGEATQAAGWWGGSKLAEDAAALETVLPGRPAGRPGERVYVRFTLREKRPLALQWLHKIRQVIRARLSA